MRKLLILTLLLSGCADLYPAPAAYYGPQHESVYGSGYQPAPVSEWAPTPTCDAACQERRWWMLLQLYQASKARQSDDMVTCSQDYRFFGFQPRSVTCHSW